MTKSNAKRNLATAVRNLADATTPEDRRTWRAKRDAAVLALLAQDMTPVEVAALSGLSAIRVRRLAQQARGQAPVPRAPKAA